MHPFRALLTAVRISSTVIWPSWLASPAGQLVTAALPSAMLTMVRISSMETAASPLQLPTQALGVGVGVADGVDGALGVLLDVSVGVAVGIGE